MNPCGVEAIGITLPKTALNWFQMNPCGVEASLEDSHVSTSTPFQMNPCGVEAESEREELRGIISVSDEPLWG